MAVCIPAFKSIVLIHPLRLSFLIMLASDMFPKMHKALQVQGATTDLLWLPFPEQYLIGLELQSQSQMSSIFCKGSGPWFDQYNFH